MGDWAEAAQSRFQVQASKERRAEELDLQNHSKTVAGAERRWQELARFIKSETSDFNRRMDREFFTFYESPNEIRVTGPKRGLTVTLDLRTPDMIAIVKPESPTFDDQVFRFSLQGGGVLIIDKNGDPIPVATLGGRLLDPLVI